jgi:hypothetical protein
MDDRTKNWIGLVVSLACVIGVPLSIALGWWPKA